MDTLWIILVLLTIAGQSQAQVCNEVPSENAYTDLDNYSRQNPKDATWCRTMIQKLYNTYESYMTDMLGCTEGTRSAFRSKMEATTQGVNDNCKTVHSCRAGSGTRYYAFLRSLFGYEMKATVSAIQLQFNSFSNNVNNQLTDHCEWLRNMRYYMHLNATGCGVVEEAVRELHTGYPQLKMALDICGINFKDYERPIASNCPDKDTRKQRILNNCAFTTNFDKQFLKVSDICPTMQQQIDCILQEAGPCSSLVDLMLYPRLYTYGMANTLLKCNISMHGFWIKDKLNNCGEVYYGELYECYYQNGLGEFLLYGTLATNKDHGYEGFRRLFTLYSMEPESPDCTRFQRASYQDMKLCVENKLSCTFPFPTFPTQGSTINEEVKKTYKDLKPYHAAKYFNLGPTSTSDYGPEALQYYSAYRCNTGCSTSFNQLWPKMDEYEAGSCTRDWSNVISRAQNGDCSTLRTRTTCITGVTQQCPAFISSALYFLNSTIEYRGAVQSCNIEPRYWPETQYSQSTNVHTGFTATTGITLPTTSYRLNTVVSGPTWFRTQQGGSTIPGQKTTTPASSVRSSPSAVFIFISFIFISLIQAS